MRKSIGIAVSALLVIAAFGILPAAATELPDYQHLYVTPANDIINNDLMNGNGTYLIDWTNSTGGLNALHISTSNATTSGDITSTTSTSGTFYVTDTGGRNYQDNIVLLVGVYEAGAFDSLSLKINSSGYNWTTTANGLAPPSSDVHYQNAAIGANTIFTDSDFISGIAQVWKPGPTDVYPIYNGQDTSNSVDFELMFIDLHVGTFSNVSVSEDIDDFYYSGNVRVDYDLSGSSLTSGSKVVFNAYAWNNLTSYPYTQAIRWTNRVYESGGSSSGSSGWMVNYT